MKILYLPNEYSQQRQRQKKAWVYPVLMAMEAQWYREQGHEVIWDRLFYKIDDLIINAVTGKDEDPKDADKIITQPEGLDFLSLPIPDRFFTNAFDKRYQLYGNYKHHPATHMQVADGCWHGKCTFCVENGREYKVRPMKDVMNELSICELMGFKEVFDDSGTFPDGRWLTDFCNEKIRRKSKIVLGCNMRLGADVDFKLMKQAGFRMLLYGIESANQTTLDRIKKGTYAKDIIPTLKEASRCGLEPHIAVMFGQPGEGEKEERKTLELVHYLLRKGYSKTAQASVYSIPGRARVDTGYAQKIYDVWKYPDFWVNKIRDIKSLEDLKYLLKSIRKGIVRD